MLLVKKTKCLCLSCTTTEKMQTLSCCV